MPDREAMSRRFGARYGAAPEFWVRAPGRVNLIGEHTDYNDGFVLPAAIDREMAIAVGRRDDGMVLLESLDYPHPVEFDLRDVEKAPDDPWGNYVRAVAWALGDAGVTVAGWHGVARGNVPIASGLSSSAALEVAVALAFQSASGFAMDGVRMAQLCQRAENAFVGVNCGIMDQFVSRMATRGHALLIDCRSLAHRAVPLPADHARIVVADTAKRRGLVDSEYNARRAECEEAVRLLSRGLPGITALRDVTPDLLEAHREELPDRVLKRARHVVTENDRVLRAVERLEADDLAGFGRLMDASHVSLRDDYEVSCAELDAMVELARGMPGVLGSRMTGAGFGGCTVSLVEAAAVESFLQEIPPLYRERAGLEPTLYVTAAAAGAEIE